MLANFWRNGDSTLIELVLSIGFGSYDLTFILVSHLGIWSTHQIMSFPHVTGLDTHNPIVKHMLTLSGRLQLKAHTTLFI